MEPTTADTTPAVRASAEVEVWLTLMLADIGGSTLQRLLRQYRTAAELVQAARVAPDLELPRAPALARIRAIQADEVANLAARLSQKHYSVVGYTDSAYPKRLHEISSPPAGLILAGSSDPRLFQRLAVAIVGTRQPPDWAARLATSAGLALAERGLTVISGLAVGVDASAHRGALRAAGGRTLAVLGCGHDRLYPARHAGLAAEIARSGAIVSEYLPDVEAAPQHLAARNRIISGLASALIVIAARRESGSRHAVAFAHRQGRLVLAVPGTPGCDELLAAGRADPLELPADWDRLAATIARL